MMSVSVSEQISLLLEYGAEATGGRHSLSEIAEATGISYQALANLIQGKSTNPRLNTLLAICQYYGISLDYFACETVDACQECLYRHQVRVGCSLIGEIEHVSGSLSPKGRRNVLAIMEWMRLATPTSG